MNTAVTTIEIGQSIVIDGEIVTIESIKGRWVKLSDDTNISRADAVQGREEYLEDAETLGEELDSEEDDQTDEDGANDQADADDEAGYQGSMIRLRERMAEGAYQKAPNGQPCCGDRVATLLGTLQPLQVIRACIVAMALPSNPYNHLNVGQQSMNLRNKLRGCFKREEFGFGVLVEAVETVKEQEEALQAEIARKIEAAKDRLTEQEADELSAAIAAA
ncbi:hypothetical protein UFOVP1544_20 [uncultured Caudovirales phage]|uniref:Uncharacterized protein n=1 Tax=uncultured Caudovirales phage TaxID=2100421 RepID=A0A6J7XCW2_9CAUD|nr:hypothetical protein UFOVP1544_20 [uncultured Caudovirales phage]